MISCPICKTSSKEENQEYCTTCAWEFEYFLGELGERERKKYDVRLQICKGVYEKAIAEPKAVFKEQKVEIFDDIVVIDGLMYQNQSFVDVYTWDEAMQYAKELRLGGYDDWRLPTKNELHQIMTKKPRHKLEKDLGNYVCKEFIENMPQRSEFWTSEIYQKDSSYILGIIFFTNTNSYFRKTSRRYVLCVR